MPTDDRIRWDARYRQGPFDQLKAPRTFLVESQAVLPPAGLALDVAMGLGGNAAFMRSHGLRVIGVDVSGVAVRSAKADHPDLDAFIADLDQIDFPAASFDVIINFYYLNRPLWARYPRLLKPGGLLIIETLTQAIREIKPEIDPAYLLNPGELKAAFPALDLVYEREGWMQTRAGQKKAVASLIARKHPDQG